MKDYGRLKASAELGNHPHGYVVLRLQDQQDPGPFGLVAKMDNDAIYLPHASEPGYRLAVTASDPETLRRFANALLALARRQSGDDEEGDA